MANDVTGVVRDALGNMAREALKNVGDLVNMVETKAS